MAAGGLSAGVAFRKRIARNWSDSYAFVPGRREAVLLIDQRGGFSRFWRNPPEPAPKIEIVELMGRLLTLWLDPQKGRHSV